MRPVGRAPDGWVVVASHDRWHRAFALDPQTGRVRRLVAPTLKQPRLDGWCVRRQRRVLALYRLNGRLQFQCARQRWDVEDATASRGQQGLRHWLVFERDGAVVGRCRWLDSEIARRWFIPPEFDFSYSEREVFDWGVFVESVMSGDRRGRVGRPPEEWDPAV